MPQDKYGRYQFMQWQFIGSMFLFSGKSMGELNFCEQWGITGKVTNTLREMWNWMGSRLFFSRISMCPEFVVPFNKWLWLGNNNIFGTNIGYLNPCIGNSMAKKFWNLCLVPSNGMLLVQNALRTIRWELDQGVETYSEVNWRLCFLVSHQTGIRKKRNTPYLEESMGINLPGSSHMIDGFCWTYPQHGKFFGKPMYQRYTGNLMEQKDL